MLKHCLEIMSLNVPIFSVKLDVESDMTRILVTASSPSAEVSRYQTQFLALPFIEAAHPLARYYFLLVFYNGWPLV